MQIGHEDIMRLTQLFAVAGVDPTRTTCFVASPGRNGEGFIHAADLAQHVGLIDQMLGDDV